MNQQLNALPLPKTITVPNDIAATYIHHAHYDIVLSMSVPDSRLVAAIKRMFYGHEPILENVEAEYPYVMFWGPLYERDMMLQLPNITAIPEQGYRLRMASESIVVVAQDAAGLFYGLHTLKQRLDASTNGQLTAIDLLDYPDTAVRMMNYDFRQTFSKPELLVEYIGKLAELKANALLIEYEDKFPFEQEPGRHFVHPKHALTSEEFELLCSAAHEHFIEIVPLQQSLGHLEYILGRDDYRHLRETSSSTGELCPLKEDAFTLVTGLIRELAERHPNSRYMHLGCDEVYSLCECPDCRIRFGNSRHAAFVYFVNRLIAFTCSMGKQPIIWQDMLDDNCPDWVLAELDPRVTVMIWHYNGKNISGLVTPLAVRLRSYGIEVWGAPAVRCFDRKDDQNYPLVEARLSNIGQWCEVADNLTLGGLVGTNWTAVFSLGVPYGIFETTWYTMAYFADRSWNRSIHEADDRFIERFLYSFHGIDPVHAAEVVGPYTNEDYYVLAPKLAKLASRNVDILELISIMLEFETAADRSRTIHKYAYRHALHTHSDAEWTSLMNNYRITRTGLTRTRTTMDVVLRRYQPENMAEHYVLSRYYVHDHLEESLYKPMGLEIPSQLQSS
ncbi:family 20 glycosylhydrolase [Paenibacillus sp. strain BS8-2]